MSSELLKTVLITLTILLMVIRIVLNELDIRSSAESLKSDSSDVTAKAVQYVKAKHRFESFTFLIQTVLIVSFISFGWFGQIYNTLKAQITSQLWLDWSFMMLLLTALFIISIPRAIYKTFVIEAKFNFNKTKVSTFVTDRIKGLVLGALILGPVLLLLLWIYQLAPEQIWWIAFVVVTIVNLVLFAIGTSVLMPMFNKLQPLPDGELKQKIQELCDSQNYRLKRIFVMDGSKRSSKTNAFFSGMGKSKTIVLFDSLIEKHPVEEVVAVMGHEIGHDRLGHVRTILWLSLFESFIVFGLFGWATNEPAFAQAVGGSGAELVLGLIAFSIALALYNFLTGIIDNTVSRRNEHGADVFSAKIYGSEKVIAALQRLKTDNLANPKPHPLYVMVHYDHPPVGQRVEHIRELKLS
jgi:STE24 endopeptidase